MFRLKAMVYRLFSVEASAVLAQSMVGLSLVAAFVTFLTLTGYTPIIPTHNVVVTALSINAVLVLGLLVLLVRELVSVHRARKQGTSASRLHVRIIWLFAFIASVPVILVAIAASLTLERGINQLVQGVVERTINSSVNVADAYIDEQVQRLRIETSAMAGEIERAIYMLDWNPEEFRKVFNANIGLRGFVAGDILSAKNEVLMRLQAQSNVPLPPQTEAILQEVGKNDDIFANITVLNNMNFITSLVRLEKKSERFLYVMRPINPVITRHAQATRLGALEFQQFQARKGGVQLAFALMFALMALIVTFSAIWVGIAFANRIIAPIKRLMNAANKVAGGDLEVQVPVRPSEGDFATLGATFNNMTRELKSQHDEVLLIQAQLDQRARFTTAVLDGVSAGVIGLDSIGRITLFNPRAAQLLGEESESFQERDLVDILPELAPLLHEAQTTDKDIVQGQLMLLRKGRERMINVRITAEQGAPDDHGSVVTLDDMTDLVAAQRNSAWADVARRIAHEIKNPLTPIQLSAERLERKFGNSIEKDSDIFKQCTSTIIRQVGDIGRMVDEFSSFARMPKPDFEMADLNKTIKEIQFLSQVGFPETRFVFETPIEPINLSFDRRLISQALTNILKNAAESIAQTDNKGLVNITAKQNGELVYIDIVDNGIGLPKENRNRLAEPYVTTRAKGTGLGLAIVGRILEDHGGKIELLDREDGEQGALMRLSLSIKREEK